MNNKNTTENHLNIIKNYFNDKCLLDGINYKSKINLLSDLILKLSEYISSLKNKNDNFRAVKLRVLNCDLGKENNLNSEELDFLNSNNVDLEGLMRSLSAEFLSYLDEYKAVKMKTCENYRARYINNRKEIIKALNEIDKNRKNLNDMTLRTALHFLLLLTNNKKTKNKINKAYKERSVNFINYVNTLKINCFNGNSCYMKTNSLFFHGILSYSGLFSAIISTGEILNNFYFRKIFKERNINYQFHDMNSEDLKFELTTLIAIYFLYY